MRRRLAYAATLAVAVPVVAAAPARADLPGAGIVTNIGGAFGGWAWDKVTSGLASWILDAVGSLIEGVIGFLQTSSKVDVGAVWFSGPGSPYATVREIAVVLVVAFALLGILSGTLRGDPLGMAARVAVGLPVTALAMAVVIPVVAIGLQLTDVLSAAVLDPARAPAISFLSGFGATAAVASGGFAVVVVGLVAVLAALVLWAELLVRAALIYLLVALSPLVLAATLWPAARGILRRTAEVLIALIASKLVVSIAIAVGAAALGGAGTENTSTAGAIGTLMVGTAVLAMSAFSPFLILRLLPIMESAALAQGVSRAPLRTAMAATVAVGAASRLAGGGGSGGSGEAPPPAAPPAAAGGGGELAGRGTGPPSGPAAGPSSGPAASQSPPEPAAPPEHPARPADHATGHSRADSDRAQP